MVTPWRASRRAERDGRSAPGNAEGIAAVSRALQGGCLGVRLPAAVMARCGRVARRCRRVAREVSRWRSGGGAVTGRVAGRGHPDASAPVNAKVTAMPPALSPQFVLKPSSAGPKPTALGPQLTAPDPQPLAPAPQAISLGHSASDPQPSATALNLQPKPKPKPKPQPSGSAPGPQPTTLSLSLNLSLSPQLLPSALNLMPPPQAGRVPPAGRKSLRRWG